MRFDRQHIVVTGGAGEIGGRIVARLSAEGARVTVLDRQAPSDPTVAHLACDLSDPDSLETAAARLAAERCDVLMNVAGVQYFGPVEGESPGQLARTFAINLVAPIRLTQAVLPAMKARRRGQIVNIGSILGSIPFAHFATYSASKAGLQGFSQALRRELAGTGVDVTHVAPRAVKTGFNSAKVLEFAALTGMTMDDPDRVADRIVQAVAQRRRDVLVGFPESLFVRLNALTPGLIDAGLAAGDRRAAKLFA